MKLRNGALLSAFLCAVLGVHTGATPAMTVAPIEITAQEGQEERADDLAAELQELLVAELSRRGFNLPGGDESVLELSPYLILSGDRIGFGANIYDAESRYLVTGDLAVASNERALASAIRGIVDGVADGAHRYLERAEIEEQRRVERLVFTAAQSGVALHLPDGSLLGVTDESGRLVVEDVPLRRGQYLVLRLQRAGHYEAEHSAELAAREQEIELPRLRRRTRVSAGVRHLPAMPAGGGLVARFYPIVDQIFVEAAGAIMRLEGDKWLTEDLTFAKGRDEGRFEDWSDFDDAGREAGSFTLIDTVMSLGTYLFVRPGRFLRPGLQTGVGVWSARSGDWSHSTLYLAPVNPFLSLGSRRLRGRLVGGFRYTLDSEDGPFGRRVYGGNDRFAYLWLEVGYTW